MRTSKPYTQVELDFIKDHADLRPRQLAELFNTTFGRYAEPKRMSEKLRAMGIEPNIRREHKYTDDQIAWLAANVPTMGERELAAAFNERYGANVDSDSLATYVRKYTRVMRTKETKRRSQSLALRRFSPGNISVQKRGGKAVKVILVEENGERRWVQYGRYLWEQKHGKLPDGWVVVFLNNDATDCRMENLRAVSPYVMALMARNRWYKEDPDLTLVGIMLCELAQASNRQIRV